MQAIFELHDELKALKAQIASGRAGAKVTDMIPSGSRRPPARPEARTARGWSQRQAHPLHRAQSRGCA